MNMVRSTFSDPSFGVGAEAVGGNLGQERVFNTPLYVLGFPSRLEDLNWPELTLPSPWFVQNRARNSRIRNWVGVHGTDCCGRDPVRGLHCKQLFWMIGITPLELGVPRWTFGSLELTDSLPWRRQFPAFDQIVNEAFVLPSLPFSFPVYLHSFLFPFYSRAKYRFRSGGMFNVGSLTFRSRKLDFPLFLFSPLQLQPTRLARISQPAVQ